MTHEEARSSQAADRYLLGELSGAEHEEFEEHFFACPECAEDVEAGAVFIANARAVFSEEPRAAASRWLALRQPFFAVPLAASILLALLTGYLLGITIPGLRRELALTTAPQAYPAVFLRAVSRGSDQAVEVQRSSRFVGLSLDAGPGQIYPEYVGELWDGSGAQRVSLALPGPARPGAPLHFLLPAARLAPGSYTLVLRGRDGPNSVELNRYRFTIQLK